MKTLLAIVCAFFVGTAAGVFCARLCYAKELYTQTVAGVQQVGQQQAILTALSLGVLDELEADQHDRAKSILARQIASYYRTFHDFHPISPETRQLMQRIEASSNKSPALKEAHQ